MRFFGFAMKPLGVFDYQTPEQLVSDGRTEDILRYVKSLQAGAVG